MHKTAFCFGVGYTLMVRQCADQVWNGSNWMILPAGLKAGWIRIATRVPISHHATGGAKIIAYRTT